MRRRKPEQFASIVYCLKLHNIDYSSWSVLDNALLKHMRDLSQANGKRAVINLVAYTTPPLSNFFLSRLKLRLILLTHLDNKMVSTRASVKKTDVVSQTDSEGSVSKIETTKTQELYVESDDDSDDEAPEAISTSTAKSSALQTAQAKREAQAK